MGIARHRQFRLHIWVFVVGTLTAASAHAYELKPTEGSFVHWRQDRVTLHVAAEIRHERDDDDDCEVDDDCEFDDKLVLPSLELAADSWRHIGGAPVIEITGGGPNVPNAHDGINSVHVLDRWPTSLYGNSLAVTVSTFEVTGRLLDTDILINGTKALALLDEEDPDRRHFDLPSVLTHEMGHVLGLDESSVPGATMWPNLRRGDVFQRTLEEDDELGIVALYGELPATSPEAPALACDASGGAGPEHAWLVVLMLAVIARRRVLAGPESTPTTR